MTEEGASRNLHAEGEVLRREELDLMLSCGQKGIEELFIAQQDAVDRAISQETQLITTSGIQTGISSLLYDIEILTLADFPNIVMPPEDGDTFEKNAQRKLNCKFETLEYLRSMILA